MNLRPTPTELATLAAQLLAIPPSYDFNDAVRDAFQLWIAASRFLDASDAQDAIPVASPPASSKPLSAPTFNGNAPTGVATPPPSLLAPFGAEAPTPAP